MTFEYEITDGTSHLHGINLTVDEFRVPAHLHSLVEEVSARADPFGGHVVLAEEPVLAGPWIGYESAIGNALTKSVQGVGTCETHQSRQG